MTTPALPTPTRPRWQPLRIGLVDLFHYDEEEFWFEDGRLLLRGNNGTGKSKVLALTLPFLLDGSVAPRRVEPDADPKKRMEWNLLLGGQYTASERTGYTWVEFGRLDDDGRPRFITLGIGLKAAAGRGITRQWFFTTSRRIGDLRLLDDNRTVVSQERLRDDLSGTGQVYTTRAAYRRAVDEAMFRLGEERYGALIDLLIQLRQPQLSKKPDEKALSAALTEALAPVDQAVVADVAESFRSLEDERAGVADARDTHRAAEDFLHHYRDYARVATRRRTTGVRLATSAYEHAGRDLRSAQEAAQEARVDVERLAARREEIAERQEGLRGQERALRESPEMREATRLENAGQAARDAEEQAGRAGAEEERAAGLVEAERAEADAAETTLEVTREEAHREAGRAHDHALAAGLDEDHPRLLGDEREAQRAVDRRAQQVRYVSGLIDTEERARAVVDSRARSLDEAQSEAVGRDEALQQARTALEDQAQQYGEAARAYVSGLQELRLAQGPEELASRSEQWARTLLGPSPLLVALDEAASVALERVAKARARAEDRAGALAEDLAGIRDRIAELEAGHDPQPPQVPGRDPEAREGLTGAPLWWLADFSPHLTSAQQAGVEAALQSAGLLDAWIFPDGRFDLPGDVTLSPVGGESRASLADVLVPTGEGVSPEAVAAVLRRIGWGAESGADIWVDGQGRWGAGPARGSWSKPAPEHLGAGARAAHRRRLLADLREEASALEEQVDAARAEAGAAAAEGTRIRDERAGHPASLEREITLAHERMSAAEAELTRAHARTQAAQSEWDEASRVAADVHDSLTQEAAELGLAVTRPELERVSDALSAYATALVAARAAALRAAAAQEAATRSRERAEEAARTLATRRAELTEWRGRATRLQAMYEELHRTVGASVADLQARLAQTTTALAELEQDQSRVTAAELAAATTLGRLEESVRDLERRRDEAGEEREAQCEALRHFTDTGLLRVALPDQILPAGREWTLTAAVDLSRTVEQHLTGVDAEDGAWARVQQRVSGASTELTTQMSRHGHTAYTEQRDDVLLVRVRYLGEEIDVDRLAERLEQDVADRERLLSAREREILENHLVNEVAGHLHELMTTAEAQIDRMNAELKARRTSTGMQLRMQWRERKDGPAGLGETKRLMIRSDATWTARDREAIGDFLQAQIARVRLEDPTGSWVEHLEQALDYRQWHTFAVERWQGGQWRSASGPASGGERALAVSVPLFAAASAHYNSADPAAPRLILLDEAFAGVDDDSRAKSLGLLATFDLDVVMTSEREWGCYPQVPGLAIAHLSRREGIDAVGVTRWRWNGVRRDRLADPHTPTGPGPEQETSLFE